MRAIEFKRSAGLYLRALRYLYESDRTKFEITVTVPALDDAIFSLRTEVHILDSKDNFVISAARGVVVGNGRINERGNPKTAYYEADKRTIFVGVDWEPTQHPLALKEFLRTIEGVDAEKQTVKIAAWYDQSSFASSSNVAYLDVEPTYEERLKLYTVQQCEEAKALLAPLVTRPMYNGKTYEEMAVHPAVSELPLFERAKMPAPYDYKWVADLEERARRLKLHEFIWTASRSAMKHQDRLRNVQSILPYLSDPEMAGVATQALGEIGDTAAADALMALIQKDIDVVGTDAHYQEKVHKSQMWAPLSLGSLDYSTDPMAYLRAEAKLLELRSIQPKLKYGGATLLHDGLTFLRPSSYLAILKSNLLNGHDTWQTARAVATIGNDYSFLLPAYVAAVNAMDERSFSAALKMIEYLRPGFPAKGLSQSLYFTDFVNAARKHSIVNGDTLIALIHLRPTKCE